MNSNYDKIQRNYKNNNKIAENICMCLNVIHSYFRFFAPECSCWNSKACQRYDNRFEFWAVERFVVSTDFYVFRWANRKQKLNYSLEQRNCDARKCPICFHLNCVYCLINRIVYQLFINVDSFELIFKCLT